MKPQPHYEYSKMNKSFWISFLLLISPPIIATDSGTVCKDIDNNEQRLKCYDLQAKTKSQPLTGTVLDYRIRQESVNLDNSFSLIAHRPTYVLPFSNVNNPNEAPFDPVSQISQQDRELDMLEVKFQISFRVPINKDFFFKNSHLWFAYTQLSLWQLYNKDNSSPFRETNYEPELIWSFLVNESFGDLKLTHLAVALNHQSNGRSEPFSRSWNRISVDSIWAYENLVFSLKPWHRLPENDVDDDNPDIEDYMGNFDFRVGYKHQDHQLSALLRSAFNEDNSRSFYELGYSFSINRKFRGYVQFTSGYGESLIDYNYRNKRFSIGVMFNDWF